MNSLERALRESTDKADIFVKKCYELQNENRSLINENDRVIELVKKLKA